MRPARRRKNPLEALLFQIRIAANNITQPAFRRAAAHDADSLAQTWPEKVRGRRGEAATMARAIMRRLPEMPPEELAQAKTDLLACHDAIGSRFEETSVVTLGTKRRRAEARPAP